VSRRCALIGVEGNHDQAFLSKVLRELLGFSRFDGEESQLDPLWRKFIPRYPPKTGRLYVRLDMPSILYTDTLSVAIYAGEGSRLIDNLSTRFADIDYSSLLAFGIVADADKHTPDRVAKIYHDGFKEYFPDFPTEISQTGTVTEGSPSLGIYVLPNNSDQGVLDTLLCACGGVAYPEYMERARAYINQFSQEEVKRIGWKPFDREKALVATVVSILKPGKTNTVSITDNAWVSLQTEQHLCEIQNLANFLRKLLNFQNSAASTHENSD
jgi:hypothetical protein